MFINRWMNIYIQWDITEPLKTRKSVMCYNMNEPWVIMLNEISQSQKGRYCMIRLIRDIYSNQLIETKYCGRCWDWRKEEIWGELIIPFPQNISYTRWKCSRHPFYNNVHMANKTILYTYKLLKVKVKKRKWKWSRSVMSNSLWPHGL